MMCKTTLTIGLNDKNTERQEIESAAAKSIIANILLDKYGVYAFTMTECSGVYRMESTGNIIFENSIRVEIATDSAPAVSVCRAMINDLKAALNQESIMIERSAADIAFI